MERIKTIKIKYFFGALLLLSFFLISCKPSVERESRTWERNSKSASTLNTKYPQFATYLKKDLDTATAAWQAALKLPNEEKKAEAMDKANDVLETKFFRQLNSIASRNDSINSAIQSLFKKRMSKNRLRKVQQKISKAREKQSASRSLLAAADTASRESALGAIDDAVGKLIDASNAVDKAKKIAKGK